MALTLTRTPDPSLVVAVDDQQTQFFTIESASGGLVRDEIRLWLDRYLLFIEEGLDALRSERCAKPEEEFDRLQIRRVIVGSDGMIELHVDHLCDTRKHLLGTLEQIALMIGHGAMVRAGNAEYLALVKVRRVRRSFGAKDFCAIHKKDYRRRGPK